MDWAWWLGAFLLLAVVEMLSVDLVLIMFAGGALVAAVLAAMGLPLAVQIAGFAVTSALLLLALRPWLLRRLRSRMPLIETNSTALVGRPAVAVAEVTERSGRVKLVGEVWSARTENDEVLEIGQEAVVVRIAGATAIVTSHDVGRRTQPRADPTTPHPTTPHPTTPHPTTPHDSPPEERPL